MSDYLQTTKEKYPLGAIVFFISLGLYEKHPRGVTHVGIVVGYENKTPKIAHANNGSRAKHVVISRLKADQEYLVAKPPEHINIDLLVALAQTVATKKSSDTPIIKYSEERSNSMQEIITDLYNSNIRVNPGKKIPEKLKEKVCEKTLTDSIKICSESLTSGAWTTIVAKSCNIFRSDLSLRLKGIDKNSYSHTIFAQQKSNLNIHYPITKFTRKGYHCVQFVVMMIQMATTLYNKRLIDTINIDNKSMPSQWYLSHKKTEKKKNEIYMPIKPESIVRNNMISEFISTLSENMLQVDGKYLSPAALLYILDDDNPPSPGGPSGGMGGWQFGSSLTSQINAMSLEYAVHRLSQRVDNSTQELPGYAKLVSKYIDLWSVRRIIRKITPNYISSRLILGSNRPGKRKDSDRDDTNERRVVARP